MEDLNRSCDFAQDVRDSAREMLAVVDAHLNFANRAIKARGAYFGNRSIMDQYRKCSDKQRFYVSHAKELDEFVRAQKELKELFPSGEVPGMDSPHVRKALDRLGLVGEVIDVQVEFTVEVEGVAMQVSDGFTCFR